VAFCRLVKFASCSSSVSGMPLVALFTITGLVIIFSPLDISAGFVCLDLQDPPYDIVS